jgi:Uma2 family endonuclease
MFSRQARLSAYQTAQPDWREKPLLIVPDLVVEIVSKTDRFSDVDRKVSRYLEDGVQAVWVIEPRFKRLIVYTSDGTLTRYAANAVVNGGDLIPGFSLSLAELFA